VGKLDLNREALSKLRVAVHAQGGRLATVGDDFPAKSGASSSLFGTLAGAQELAAAIGRVEGHADSELGTVKSRLDGVERALDAIEDNVTTAEHDTTKHLPAV
jgi:flagellin-like hook-associated protein FlgL